MAEGAAAAAGAPTEERHPGRIQVSNKQSLFFYVGLGKRLLAEHGEIHLSGLGLAVSTLVSVVELLKKDGLAVEKNLKTSLLRFQDESKTRQGQKPRLEVVLGKAPGFDEALARSNAHGKDSAAAGSSGNAAPAAAAATAAS